MRLIAGFLTDAKRLKEMKQMQKDPNASEKARQAERKANERSGLISIKPMKLEIGGGKATGGGFKKGGFKNAFGEPQIKVEEDAVPAKSSGFRKIGATAVPSPPIATDKPIPTESDTDEDHELYDPRQPTGCDGSCRET